MHHIDELLGDAPIRTVREIAVADIEPPPDDPSDLEHLEGSIRKLGVLEPLIVGRQGGHFRVIAGKRRLRAARRVGLGTVPCLVHDVDDEMVNDMREAAARQVSSPVTDPPAIAESTEPVRSASTADVSGAREFVSALLPVMNAAGDDRFRWSVLADLAGVELLRARTIESAIEVLARTSPLERRPARAAELLERVLEAVRTEARLRGITIDVSAPHADFVIATEPQIYLSAATGLLLAMLAMSPREGARLDVRMHGTKIRPALILEVSLTVADDVWDVDEPPPRFFDAEWHDHPSGSTGRLMLAALARVARLHGGRVDARVLTPTRRTVTFVVPQPLNV